MTRYLLREKLFAFGDDYVIRDQHERECFFVDGRAFSLGDKLSFQDMRGRELAFIRQKLFTFGRTYEIWRGRKLSAVVKKQLFTLLHCRFTVDVPGPEDLEAKGDFLDHEYVFRRGAEAVATVSKRWFTFGDSYGVEVASGNDDVLILASAVVIDQCCHDRRR